MNEIQIKYVSTDSLIPYANNARAHGDHDVDAIMASIREFAIPIIIGIVAGVYSANLINGYVWAWLENRKLAAKKK